MFKIEPVFKDYIWGGNKLRSLYGKQSDLDIVAESWELSTHPAGVCRIGTGENAGMLLSEYVKQMGEKVIGNKGVQDIPILIKLIDAKDNLSVQVHPDNEYARVHEGDLGKTEMWYVLEAEEGAQLVYGVKETITKEQFKEAIEHNVLREQLNYVDVHKGDVFFITPGTIHAIGKGIVIAEIQQSSNVTYRVYDYGRVGTDGKPRELHIEKAMDVAHLEKASDIHNETVKEVEESQYIQNTLGTTKVRVLASCEYFRVESLQIAEQVLLRAEEESFHHLLVIDGDVVIDNEKEMIKGSKGDSIFIPAGEGKYTIRGKGEVILSRLE